MVECMDVCIFGLFIDSIKSLIMHYLFYLGHPAHFHLFKNTIKSLIEADNQISVLIKKKDILEDLIKRSGINYLNILPEGRKNTRSGIVLGVLKRDWRLFRYCFINRPDVMIGTSTEIGHAGTLLRIPSINVNEDDANVVPLYSKLSYPFCSYILSPAVCTNGKWENKSIKYQGYHELAYLHPGNFIPSKEIVENYITTDKPYFLIRFAQLNAHHDKGVRGISDEFALKIIEILKPYGNVFITSERKLSKKFERFRLQIDPLHIHHVMAFASLYIGDSQTMAAESGVLGIPFIRFNDFVGRIGYLNELENKYQLGYGVKPDEPERLFQLIRNLMKMENRTVIFICRRQRMLQEKINVSKFLTWFISDYPTSVEIMRKNPDAQCNFR